jgi:hypothetical protein
MRSVIRREATWISQPTGFSGVPCAGHCVPAAIIASCTASSESAKSPKRRTSAARTRGAASRIRSSISAGRPIGSVLDRAHHLADLDRLFDRGAVVRRRGRGLGGDLDLPLSRLDVDRPVAGEQLLGLGEGPVGDDRRRAAVAASSAGARPACAATSSTAARPRRSSTRAMDGGSATRSSPARRSRRPRGRGRPESTASPSAL